MTNLLSPDGVIDSPLQATGLLVMLFAGMLILLRGFASEWRTAGAISSLASLWRLDTLMAVSFGVLAGLNLFHHALAPLQGVFRPEVGDGGLIENLTITVMIFPVVIFIASWLGGAPRRHFGFIFMSALSIVLIVGFGEEVSWGQHWFGLAVPRAIAETNLQAEFNLHNYIRPGMMEALYYGVGLVLLLVAGNLRLILQPDAQTPGMLPLKALLVLSAIMLSHHVFQELGELILIVTAFLVWLRLEDGRMQLRPRWLQKVTAI